MSGPGYPEKAGWRTFVGRHKGAVAAFAIAVGLAFAWAVYVFLWFAAMAESTGLVPATLGLWTMGDLLNFIVYAAFWELLLVGSSLVVGAIVVLLWWRRLPATERESYHLFSGRRRRSRGGGGLSSLLFIAFAIKVYADGMWDVPISSYTLDYVVGSVFTILVWGLVILGIPAALAAIWWVSREKRRA